MLLLSTSCLLPLMVCMANALTSEQAAEFAKDGVKIVDLGTSFRITSNGLPEHDYGPFPSNDNPNEAMEQEHNYTVPKVPTEVNPPGCLPMGAIGIAINGVVLFNPYTVEQCNAVEGENAEVFDDCDGHPQMEGVYHYHKIPSCLFNDTLRDQLLGVAFDGYPIYGPIDENGRTLKSADLDLCHGRSAANGYRYHMTIDFPYILGCFKGEVDYEMLAPAGPPGGPGGPGGPPQGGNRPPPGQNPPPGAGPPPDGGGPPPNGTGPYGGGLNMCRYANETNPGDRCESDKTNSASFLASSLFVFICCILFA